MDNFPGSEFYDYYESVTAVCLWPGCGWEAPTEWSEDMPDGFREHFAAVHAGQSLLNRPR